MRKIKQHSSVKAYLDSVGVLQNGSKEDISRAKKQYWKEYDRLYKRNKRHQKREYIVSFNSDELAAVITTAKSKGMKVPEYIRQATRADMGNAYVTPYPHILKEISQLLSWYKSSVKNIAEKDKKNWLGISRDYENLQSIISNLRSEIQGKLREAPPLMRVIEEAIQANPQFITAITNLISKYHDRQKHDAKNQKLETASGLHDAR